MKFLSFLTKTPNHRNFNYTPRYYDPIKERIAEREDQLRSEQEQQDAEGNYRPGARMMGSFRSAYRRERRAAARSSTTLIRSLSILTLVLLLMAYLQWGSKAIYYGLFAFVPLYLYWKVRSIREK